MAETDAFLEKVTTPVSCITVNIPAKAQHAVTVIQENQTMPRKVGGTVL